MRQNSRCPMSRAVRDAYRRGEDDETLEPLVLVDESGKPAGRIEDGDSVVFYDIRGEREVELTRSFVDRKFRGFPTGKKLRPRFLTMIEYGRGLPAAVAYPPEGKITGTLCDAIDRGGLKFARIAESEKAIHVTYFLDGKSERKFRNEERLIIPSLNESPEIAPGMRAKDIESSVIKKLDDEKCAAIIANFANIDVVGHTENRGAVLRAVKAVDRAVGNLVKEAAERNVVAMVTADHGTAEKWLYPDGKIDTGHTSSPVPLVIVDTQNPAKTGLRKGCLTDIAPTALEILKIRKPAAMTGKPLFANDGFHERRRLLLLILDGWGIGKKDKGDLIFLAGTPNMDNLMRTYPSTRLVASGRAVGMPPGTVGNSETGHLHIGAGRCVDSDKWRIEKAIRDGSFYRNDAITGFLRGAGNRGALHILGIVSFYSSHGSVEYAKALLRMAKTARLRKVYIHSILGRRGEKPESGAFYVGELERFAHRLGTGAVVSVIGRHWALDREGNWDRVEKTYRMLVYGEGRPVRNDQSIA